MPVLDFDVVDRGGVTLIAGKASFVAGSFD
jgi:hypothetical protein